MTTRNFTVRLTPDLVAQLQRDAAENERTITGSIRVILRRYFAERVEQDKGDELKARIASITEARP